MRRQTEGQPMKKLVVLIFVFLLIPISSVASKHETPVVRIGVLQFGTVNWELDVLKHHGFDEKFGVNVEVVPLGSKNATSVSLQGGAVDIIVTDWIWVSRMRHDGTPYTFFPYSMTVGSLYVRPDSGIESLPQLQGKKLGIAGGPVDKSWLLLRAYAQAKFGLDLNKALEPTFAAPPLLNELMLRGDIDAVLNFWHYGARLEAAGMKPLIRVPDLSHELGISASVPLLGWVFNEQWAKNNQSALISFLRGSYAAKQLLATSDSEWERIRPLTKANNDITLHALRDAYREGIPRQFTQQEMDAATAVFAILVKEGGEKLAGGSTALSQGTFWTLTSPQELIPRK
jgi:NitT/TauT family transport system substrate-binding protein